MGLEPHLYPALPNLNRKFYLMLYQKMSVRKIFASFLYRLFKYLELFEELFPRYSYKKDFHPLPIGLSSPKNHKGIHLNISYIRQVTVPDL